MYIYFLENYRALGYVIFLNRPTGLPCVLVKEII